MTSIDFDVAVFAVNEASTIEACIASIDHACSRGRGHISVLLNGTSDGTATILEAMRLKHATMSVYFFSVADKSNAINHYFYNLRRDAAAHFGIDAYTRISAGSLQAMVEAFKAQPEAFIASGIPVNGRSAQAVREQTLKGQAGIRGIFTPCTRLS
jgi:hypothetical protein